LPGQSQGFQLDDGIDFIGHELCNVVGDELLIHEARRAIQRGGGKTPRRIARSDV